MHHGFHKNIQQHNCFSIDDNQKCFLSSKSSYYNDFWRSCDTEDWSNDAENTALITEINYILTYIHIEKLFEIIIIFHNITDNCSFDYINAALVSWREQILPQK